MQPTLRHVPPSAPRFSMQETYPGCQSAMLNKIEVFAASSYLESSLASLYGRNVSSDTAANDDEVLFL